jgi:hypothetical protein
LFEKPLGIRVAIDEGMTRHEHVRRLLAESMREVGVLVLVFAPLESTFSDLAIDGPLLFAVMTLSLALIGCGILVETKK